jgi:hypothetical protein
MSRWLLAILLATILAAGRERVSAQVPFRRGDVRGDLGVSPSDASYLLDYLFTTRGPARLPCLDAADADDDGRLLITDAIYILAYLFLGGPAPPPPFGECTSDPTPDALECEGGPYCRQRDEFFGRTMDSEALIVVIDRSELMHGAGEVGIAKKETLTWLISTETTRRFGIIASDERAVRFPDAPDLAFTNDPAVEGARQFVSTLLFGSRACLLEGLGAALDWLDALEPGTTATIALFSGGGVECPPSTVDEYRAALLEEVRTRNAGRARLLVLGALVWQPGADAFLRALAEQNGGEYIHLDWGSG